MRFELGTNYNVCQRIICGVSKFTNQFPKLTNDVSPFLPKVQSQLPYIRILQKTDVWHMLYRKRENVSWQLQLNSALSCGFKLATKNRLYQQFYK